MIQKWEYMVIKDGYMEGIERLNSLGKEGWEVVGTNYAISYGITRIILKRPLP